jgi:hypothetical protein
VTVVDIAADVRFGQIALALRSAGIRGALSVPVEIEGGPVGTLDLFTAAPRTLTGQHSLSSAGSSPAASDGPPEVLAMSHGNEDQTT